MSRVLIAGLVVGVLGAGGCVRLFGKRPPRPDEAAAPAQPAGPQGLVPLGRDDGTPAAATIRGKVLAVDKMVGVVVINVGELQGVRPPYAFIVYRGEKFIGKIVVDESFPDMSSAHYGKTMKGHVEVGDEVTTKLAGQP